MLNVLITGATGNVGIEVINSLNHYNSTINIVAAVRNINKEYSFMENNVELRKFDFEDKNTFSKSLYNIDIVFLLRPPHITDIGKYFTPLFDEMKNQRIHKIVFLSVQGVQKSKVIPHNKIEKLIEQYKFDYVFLRPSYFMQNLTTTLIDDITRNEIILPSKKAKFNWIDIYDIGLCAATIISDFEKFKYQKLELTGSQNLSFAEVVKIMNSIIGSHVIYRSVNPLYFFRNKIKKGIKKEKVIVIMLLHLLPRFQKSPVINENIMIITGQKPKMIEDFIIRNKDIFLI